MFKATRIILEAQSGSTRPTYMYVVPAFYGVQDFGSKQRPKFFRSFLKAESFSSCLSDWQVFLTWSSSLSLIKVARFISKFTKKQQAVIELLPGHLYLISRKESRI